MRLKYEPASRHYRVRCDETAEEKDFTTEAQCLAWADKVAHTFAEQKSFTITRVVETSAKIWSDQSNLQTT